MERSDILEKRLKRTLLGIISDLEYNEIEFPDKYGWIEESWDELRETVHYLPDQLRNVGNKVYHFLNNKIRDKKITPQNDTFDFLEMRSELDTILKQIEEDDNEAAEKYENEIKERMRKIIPSTGISGLPEPEEDASDIYVTEEYDPDESIFSVGYVLDEIPRSIMVKAADEKEAYDKVKKQYPTAEIFGAKKELNVEEMIKRGKPILEELSDDVKVREWYVTAFPNDELGFGINPDITFTDLNKAIEDGSDVYALLDVNDSIIRERLFDKLAELTGVSYDDIFEKWVNTNPEAAKDGFEVEVKETETKEESLNEKIEPIKIKSDNGNIWGLKPSDYRKIEFPFSCYAKIKGLDDDQYYPVTIEGYYESGRKYTDDIIEQLKFMFSPHAPHVWFGKTFSSDFINKYARGFFGDDKQVRAISVRPKDIKDLDKYLKPVTREEMIQWVKDNWGEETLAESLTVTESLDNGNDPHKYIELGTFNRTPFSATIYDKTGNIYIKSIHPYDDANYSWARSLDGGKTFDIFRDGKKIDLVTCNDTEKYQDVVDKLVEVDKDIKPRMMYDSLSSSSRKDLNKDGKTNS